MDYRRKLNELGLKATPCRKAILQRLAQEGEPMAHCDLESDPELAPFDRVTLYRNLKAMEERKMIHRILGIDGVWRYCIHDEGIVGCPGNHAHLICIECGRMVCLKDQPIPNISLPEGWTIKGKQLLGYGICDECNSKKAKDHEED
ncbi:MULTISPECIES: Fur family transcriptional regulator [Dethiosulfovibrio]|uniref:Transcriptional repressor n=2 Tax=Dethiosulfovibrio TaxID=47054 RepID=A0ABS9ENG0_9BACT|nr:MULTISPECIES: Fur family transcriptional regulator [Dethiosulfovibrio]MCF4112884.1 transcriptional repressor [Dethiosulfovibrio russensis]MCF4141348.1 transcriptional repressor [Dethiosulfovibrio marinus]MCF4145678.1 transcriptional repressor [Dethiosulfovibrio acidaminovorans]MEA3284589.1 Fur family transcriptional regulator [Synergistota bacterium]